MRNAFRGDWCVLLPSRGVVCLRSPFVTLLRAQESDAADKSSLQWGISATLRNKDSEKNNSPFSASQLTTPVRTW